MSYRISMLRSGSRAPRRLRGRWSGGISGSRSWSEGDRVGVRGGVVGVGLGVVVGVQEEVVCLDEWGVAGMNRWENKKDWSGAMH